MWYTATDCECYCGVRVGNVSTQTAALACSCDSIYVRIIKLRLSRKRVSRTFLSHSLFLVICSNPNQNRDMHNKTDVCFDSIYFQYCFPLFKMPPTSPYIYSYLISLRCDLSKWVFLYHFNQHDSILAPIWCKVNMISIWIWDQK